MFSLICAWINGGVNNREAGDLRRHRAHYDVIAMHLCATTHTTESSKSDDKNTFTSTIFRSDLVNILHVRIFIAILIMRKYIVGKYSSLVARSTTYFVEFGQENWSLCAVSSLQYQLTIKIKCEQQNLHKSLWCEEWSMPFYYWYSDSPDLNLTPLAAFFMFLRLAKTQKSRYRCQI